MAAGRERLQQKHPQVRHEVLRDAIVRIVEKYFQFAGPGAPYICGASSLRQMVRSGKQGVERSPDRDGDVGVFYVIT